MSKRARRHKRKSKSAIGATAVLIAALIWIIPAAGGYILYKMWSDQSSGPILSQTGGGSRLSPVTSVSLVKQDQVDELEVSSALILTPESGELYNRIAKRQRAQEQASSETAATTISAGAVEILGPQWLLEQRGDAFTIQYQTSSNMDELVAFSDQFSGDTPATIYPYKQSRGTIEYGLARGVFDSFESAKASLQGVPQDLLVHQPWIRPIADVSRQIRSFIKQ
jgi:septal ring-binding cell division protein DamX